MASLFGSACIHTLCHVWLWSSLRCSVFSWLCLLYLTSFHLTCAYLRQVTRTIPLGNAAHLRRRIRHTKRKEAPDKAPEQRSPSPPQPWLRTVFSKLCGNLSISLGSSTWPQSPSVECVLRYQCISENKCCYFQPLNLGVIWYTAIVGDLKYELEVEV